MQKFKVLLGYPYGGRASNHAMRVSHCSMFRCSEQHEIEIRDSGSSAGNFNALWLQALLAGENKTHTHFAMIASDIEVVGYPPWVDVLIAEMERLDLALISATVGIKDDRGLTSTGAGHPTDPWQIRRRFTTTEVDLLPETFTLNDIDTAIAAGKIERNIEPLAPLPLLHNNQLWIADLRKPFWYLTDAEGVYPVYFHFPERLRRHTTAGTPPVIAHERISEDWQFSMMLHKAGAKTACHRGMKILHHGEQRYPNWGNWGKQPCDAETAHGWRIKELGKGDIAASPDFAKIEFNDKIIKLKSDAPISYVVEQRG